MPPLLLPVRCYPGPYSTPPSEVRGQPGALQFVANDEKLSRWHDELIAYSSSPVYLSPPQQPVLQPTFPWDVK